MHPVALDRRALLRALGLTAASSLVLSACGGEGSDGDATAANGSPGPSPADVPAVGAEQQLFVQQASIEYLTGDDRFVAFGVRDLQNNELADADVQVFLRSLPTTTEGEPQIVAGPLAATYSPAIETGQGVYYLRATLPEPGFYEIVALAGEDHGTAAIQVVDAAGSQVAVPGEEAVAAPTATVADDMGHFSICTNDPQCGMHDVSLDDALASGSPVALLFATPQFCQTAVCGPSVATLESVRADYPEVAFVHTEIFAEEPQGPTVAGAALVPAVEAWRLPSEPWFFTIGTDGVIVDRIDGPMPAPMFRSLLDDLTA